MHMQRDDDHFSTMLNAIGWSAIFADQLGTEDAGLVPMRVTNVHRSRITVQSTSGPVRLVLPPRASTADYAVGDWILMDTAGMLVRRLDRHTLLERRGEGGGPPQLIAANVDTLFIVTSCNDDFSPARLERFLALANQAGIKPVLVLTKADKVTDPSTWRDQALALQRNLSVVSLNATSPEALQVLAPWLSVGQTVALVGSSGVGKSSLLNTLAQKAGEDAQLTGTIREDDAKGRHTTTSRSLHPIVGGAVVIDTPGIRSLHVSDLTTGLDQLFSEVAELTHECRFRDCTHAHEPGCAVTAAVRAGKIDPDRFDRWRKLYDENLTNTPVSTGPRGNKTTRPNGRRR